METAVSLTELRYKGFSVHRKNYVSYEFIKDSINQRLSKPRKGTEWKSEGVSEISTKDIRCLIEGGKRLFSVIDTAESTNSAHASIYAAEPKKGDAHARKLRFHLKKFLQNRKSLESVFGLPE